MKNLILAAVAAPMSLGVAVAPGFDASMVARDAQATRTP